MSSRSGAFIGRLTVFKGPTHMEGPLLGSCILPVPLTEAEGGTVVEKVTGNGEGVLDQLSHYEP